MKQTSPFMEVYKSKRYKSGQKALTPAQVQLFLEQITDLVHLGLFQLALTSGIRREDIVRIKIKDVGLEKRSITFYESKKSRIKTVFIPKKVANTLQMIMNANKRETYVFPGKSDKLHGKGHLSGRQAYNVFQHYLIKADLNKRPFHSLRATCMKLCQKKGWSIEQTADLVGDSIRVIQEHYTTPSEEEMVELTDTNPLI